MNKLIILRGPAASGKSTIAKLFVESSAKDTALLDFDIYRQNFLR
jgi:predicted kinase